MLQTLLVRSGKTGLGPHLPVLLRLRGAEACLGLFDTGVLLACGDSGMVAAPGAVELRSSVAEAAAQVDPARTVVHLSTPLSRRRAVLTELAGLRFRRIVIDTPLAVGLRELAWVSDLRERYWLDLVVVADWQCSLLTRRLEEIIRSGSLGPLRKISILRRRAGRSRARQASTFDIDLPPAVGVALRLAGRAEVVAAGTADLLDTERTEADRGGAWLTLAHANGVRTELLSSATLPVLHRRIILTFKDGEVIGRYPAGAVDHQAQLTICTSTQVSNDSFLDDSLTAFLLHTYRRYHRQAPATAALALQYEVVRLLSEAKTRAGLSSPSTVDD